MSDTYGHRNGEVDAPKVPGWYRFIGRVKGKGVYPPWPVYVLAGCEGGPSQADLERRFVGKWWGPLWPPWDRGHDEQLTKNKAQA